MKEKVITLPEGIDDVPDSGVSRVIEVVVKPGDYLGVGDSVIVIENDLFSLEVPAPEKGIVNEVLIQLGQAVDKRTALLKYTPLSSNEESGYLSKNDESIFLVHGRNDGLKETVARCVEKLGLPITILHEKPNEGKSLLDKFEDNAKVSFAIILMTADDKGGLKSADFSDMKVRARQNVIFELGYFIAKLSRKNVCALYESGVEMPSDYHGITYIEIDDKGAWRYQLARELSQADLKVDLNNLIK